MRTRLFVALAVVALAVVVPVPMAFGAPETRVDLLERAAEAGGEEAGFPASHVGLRWQGSDDAAVEVRWHVDGRWQPWQGVPVAHDLEDDRRGVVYSGLLRVPGASRIQTRVVAGAARSVTVAAIDTERGPRRLVPARPAGAAAATDAGSAPAPAQPPVVARAAWGADESLRTGTPIFAPLTKLIVHHTVTANDDPDPAATIRAIYSFHTQVRGWDDIGYNFLVDAQGRIYEGRRARSYGPGEVPTGENEDRQGVVGAHAEGANTGSAGIALLGDFTSSFPSPAAVSSLESWLAWKAGRHEIDPVGASSYRSSDGTTRVFANIAGHREARATECPGDRLFAALPALRQRVAQVATGRVPKGYWITGRNGAVHAFGEAAFLGDASGAALSSPLRGMAPTPTSRGYWLLGGDGGIFAFGDAAFHGSTGAIRLNKPVVGMASTPTGRGYWLVASDGGIFAFGDARFAGSTGALRLNSPIVAMEPAHDGTGYWLIARDGGVFAFRVPFQGSVPGLGLPSYAGSAALRAVWAARGYYVLGADGGVFAFGQAPFFGSRPGLSGPSAAVDLAILEAPAAAT